MSSIAFRPSLNGTTKLVAASSSTSVAATQVCTGGEQGMLLTNPSTVTLYVTIGSSTVSAAMPSTGTPIVCVPIRAPVLSERSTCPARAMGGFPP